MINRLALPPYPPEPPPVEGFEDGVGEEEGWAGEEAGPGAPGESEVGVEGEGEGSPGAPDEREVEGEDGPGAPGERQDRPEAGFGPLPPELLAERDATVLALARRALAVRRLLLLWVTAAVAVLGWAAVGLAVRSIEDGGLGLLNGLVALALAAALLISAAVALGLWVRRDQDVRDRLDAWAFLGPEPVTDQRVRAHGRSVLWLLPSVGLCLAGAAVAGRAVTRMDTVTLSATVYALGLGSTLLVTGLLGLVRSLGHQRWAGRLLDPVPVRRGGGAHR
ncbi:hypothetical protein [Streptomyces liangshanensis]|uniref:Uncharacterized protein n=1 Tax=Streptomyces liangshanensis TaxID=2717324 RepID=A0A6G9GY37_9ACTN|nr:hypothetical protein [Streptomyces liangshanensis]QIQ03134.1 hypothetical protein HA039_13065 [Streptomyces liangshanensis]